eukprot:s815_g9.t2
MSAPATDDEALLPSLVAPGLYLGTAEHARCRCALHEYERPLDPSEGCAPIRAIINVSATEPNHFADANPADAELDDDERSLCFQYHRCILEDGEQALVQAACFAEQQLRAKRPLLVHEGAEQSGQASAVIAALLVRQQWTADEAVKAIQKRRPCASPSSAVLASLARLETEVAASELKEPGLDPPLVVLPPASAEVVEGFLWLGNADAAEGVAENAFDCLVNATASLPFSPSAPSRRLRVPLTAKAGLSELAGHWMHLLHFLRSARADGCRCLIYGTHGRSRPAALAMGYIMADKGLSFAAALKAVRRKYPLARPSAALVDAVTTLSSQSEEAAGKSALKAWAGKEAGSESAPLALTNGSAKAELDEEALETAVRQLGELLPVPADLRREALVRFSGDIERCLGSGSGGFDVKVESFPTSKCHSSLRAASQLVSWLEGDVPQGSASSSSMVSASASASASAAASSSWRPEPAASTRKRSASEDGTATSEPRTEAPRLAQCYLEGQEQLPECIICGRSSKRGGTVPEPHADLGWVHGVCLQQASWS